MNERIYELATRAGAYCETYLYGGDPKPPILDSMDLEKFAELIVRECANICNKIYFERYPDAEDFERSEEGDAIKEHFGVEE